VKIAFQADFENDGWKTGSSALNVYAIESSRVF